MTVNDQSSRPAAVYFGVSQGPVLGPILFILYYAPLSSLIETHSVSNPSFANDTRLLHSCPPDQIHATVLTMQSYISDMKTWMTQNKLKLNDNKTEDLLIKSNRTTFPDAQPTSLRVCSTDILFTTCARSPGFMISNMSLDKHISNVCRCAYVEIRRTSSLRQYLTVEATTTLVCAFVLSKLDYCNSLLSGCPLYILKATKSSEPLLQAVLRLPVQTRVDYKLSTVCLNFFSDSSPVHLSDLLSVYTPSRQLRSSADTRTLCIPHVKTKTFSQRSLTVFQSNGILSLF